MKKYGLKLRKYDARDKNFEFHKVFGSVNPIGLPDEYNADNGTTMPDQNADTAYTECSAYMIADMSLDQDGIEFSEDYNFMKSLQIGGYPPTYPGCDLKSAFKAPCVFGLLPKSKAPFTTLEKGQNFAADQKNWSLDYDKIAIQYKKPAYLEPKGQYDVFNNFRSAMWISRAEKRTIGIGVTWYIEFGQTGTTGLCPDNPQIKGGGHAAKIAGWTKKNTKGELIRGGEVFLKVKSWQGRGCGDNGWLYFSQALINKLMSEWGADARLLKDVPDGTVEELKQQKVTLLEVLLAYLKNLVVALKV